ncbi:MAG: hypothetical protein WCN88_04420 [Candidatus Falkowbacteria bacterium]
MFNVFRAKDKDYVPNQHVGETKKMGIFEDAYTIAERKRKAQNDLSKGESGDDTFIDFAGRKTPIKDLNGQTEQLLSEARSAIRAEIYNNEELKNEEDIENNFPSAGKLNKKLYQKIDPPGLYGPSEPKDNLLTESPVKKRLEIRQTRKALERLDSQNN